MSQRRKARAIVAREGYGTPDVSVRVRHPRFGGAPDVHQAMESGPGGPAGLGDGDADDMGNGMGSGLGIAGPTSGAGGMDDAGTGNGGAPGYRRGGKVRCR